ncbi:MAG: type II toxin-antitoxin system HicA family toxin [bacterium]
MPRKTRLTGRELIAALRRSGFLVIRMHGSHHFLRHADAKGRQGAT